jgi:HD-GYP domain-containing protein (c-di-GMP phosphodiesterase class II)
MSDEPGARHEELFRHRDPLEALHGEGNLQQKLETIHRRLLEDVDGVDRIAVALFEPERGLVRTFIASDREETRFDLYEIPLEQAPSLAESMRTGQSRVVDDLELFSGGSAEHTRRISAKHYRSSYTVPMYHGDRFLGFIFFNATLPAAFAPLVLRTVDLHARLIESLVSHELTIARTLLASVRTIIEVVRYRDPETGNHLHRMARYAQVIARHLARVDGVPLSDEDIERIFLLAPLHDVGKIAIPDRVLLKPARLDEAEWVIMRTHSERGREIIETIIEKFGFVRLPALETLRIVTGSHHEALDGSGYPRGLAGPMVPLEARIVTVSDIFDALTSDRPYKPKWTNRQAFDYLQGEARDRVDGRCVAALAANLEAVETIQRQFVDGEGEPGPGGRAR